MQDTGFEPVLPVGEGIVAFGSLDEAADGIHAVVADWDRHAKAARVIAETYFDAKVLVARILEATPTPGPTAP